jgi:cell envelope-related function transcriptional attenuator common domain
VRTSRTASGDGTRPGGTIAGHGGATPAKEGASPARAGTASGAGARPPAGRAARRDIGDTPSGDANAATAASGGTAPRTGRPPRAAAVIGWTALSAVLPGAAHLRAGWRRTGRVLLGLYLLLLAGVAAAALTADLALLGEALEWLGTISIVAVLAALAWFALIVHSYVVLRPSELSAGGQVLTGIVAGVLSVATALPFTVAAQYANVSRQALDDVFDARGDARRAPAEYPWEGRDRINILLLGGDWQESRTGVRTDSINLASVDVRTGNTVLFGLPRNLENVRFPPGSPMAERFPDGFRLPPNPDGSREDLLFAVWEYAENHPEIFGGRRGMGPETLKGAVGHTLGLEVDWYVLVNIWGFARIIDALGGLTITVEQDVVFGRYNEGLVKAGTRRLKGADAMWYARSRTGSDDYTRMRRQRCVFHALLEQADPATVLARFTQLAEAAKGMFRTDIPRPMLRHLVPVAARVKEAKVTSVQFVPPLIHTGYPDWAKIRRITAQAIEDSMRSETPGRRPAQAAGKSSRGESGLRESGGGPGKRRERSGASSIGEGCGTAGTAGTAGR